MTISQSSDDEPLAGYYIDVDLDFGARYFKVCYVNGHPACYRLWVYLGLWGEEDHPPVSHLNHPSIIKVSFDDFVDYLQENISETCLKLFLMDEI